MAEVGEGHAGVVGAAMLKATSLKLRPPAQWDEPLRCSGADVKQ